LLKNLIAVDRMHRIVAVAVKNNGRNSCPLTWDRPVIPPAALSHGEERRGEVDGGATCEARMYTDCRI
jgi:hypothetical protein